MNPFEPLEQHPQADAESEFLKLLKGSAAQTPSTGQKPAPREPTYFENAFAELQGDFKNQYGRDFTVTGGADTPLHRKLHGGQARDVRVKDLSPDEQEFVLSRAKERGFAVRDFRRNWKPYGGSGPHLHLNLGKRSEAEQEFRSLLGQGQSASAARLAAIQEVMQTAGVDEETAQKYLDHPEGKRRYPGINETENLLNELLSNRHVQPEEPVIKLQAVQDAKTPVYTASERADNVADSRQGSFKAAQTLNQAADSGDYMVGSFQLSGDEKPEELQLMVESDIAAKAGVSPDEVAQFLKENHADRLIPVAPQGDKSAIVDNQYFYRAPAGLIANLRGWAEKTRLASMSPDAKQALAAALSDRRPLSDVEREAYGVDSGVMGYPVTLSAGVGKSIGQTASGLGRLLQASGYEDLEALGSGLQTAGDEAQGIGQAVSNYYKPEGAGGELAETAGQLAPAVAGTMLLPQARLAHLAYWSGLGGVDSLGRGEAPEEALKEAVKSGLILYATKPLSPLVSAAEEALLSKGIKLGTSAGLAGVAGYAEARAAGATPEQAIANALNFAAMGATAGKAKIEEAPKIAPREVVPQARELQPQSKPLFAELQTEMQATYGQKPVSEMPPPSAGKLPLTGLEPVSAKRQPEPLAAKSKAENDFAQMLKDSSGEATKPAVDVEAEISRAREIATASGRELTVKDEAVIRTASTAATQAKARLREIDEELAKLANDSTRQKPKATPESLAASWKAKLTDAETAARARLKERLSPNTLHDVTDIPAMVADLAIIGAAKLGRAGIDKATWAKEMLSEFGDEIRPHLAEIFRQSESRLQSEKVRALQDAQSPAVKRARLEKEAATLKQQAEKAEQAKQQKFAEIDRTSKLEVAKAVWKAGLLTGVKTHARNIGSNAAFQLFDEVAKIPAAIVDVTISAVNKRRTISGANPLAFARSSYEAATKGVKEALEIMKRGASKEDLAKVDVLREMNSGSKVLDAYVNTVFRSLGAEDRVFRTYAFRRSLEDRAKAQALTEVRQGKIQRSEVGKRQKELVEKPTEAMAAEALYDAEIATFNNNNAISEFVKGGRQALRNPQNPKLKAAGKALDAAIDFTAPFIRTPTNILARLLEASPAGFGKNAAQIAKAIASKSFSEAEQRNFAQTFGRASAGSGLIALGYTLYKKGLATGIADDEPAKRERDKAAGRPPMAIRLPNGDWHQIGGFSPLGNLIAIGATLAREQSQPLKDEAKRPGKLLSIAGKTMLEQPLLKGASALTDALQQPERKGDAFVGQLAGSVIPTIVSDVATLTDDKRREASTPWEKIKQRLPGLRQTLPVMTDAFGREMEQSRFHAIDPTVMTKAKERESLVDAELVRLDVGISRTQPKAGESGKSYAERSRAVGQKVYNALLLIMKSSRYQAADDEQKRELIEKTMRQIKTTATKQAKQQHRRAG